jgi:hypothetical protein
MNLEAWDVSREVHYDHALLDELVSLRFIDAAHNVMIMGRSGSGRPSSRPRSGTPRSGAATRCTSSVVTGCSNDSKLRGWTTVTMPRSASCSASTSSCSTTSRSRPSTVRTPRTSTSSSSTAPQGPEHHHEQPGTDRVARADGRPAAGAVRDRSAAARRARASARWSQLPQAAGARSRRSRP